MTDILASLWINIDKFNYFDRQKLAINKKDVESLKVARRNFILKPGLCLLLTVGFSRYRSRFWSYTKDHFLGQRRSVNKYKLAEINNKPKEQEVVIEYKRNMNDFDYNESNRLALNSSRKLSSRRNSKLNDTNETEEEHINLPRKGPTYSQEYFGFMKKYGENTKKFAFFKKYTSSITDKEKVLQSGENFLMNTKLIYLPFLVLLIFSAYDLGITYIAVYFKYQPLIDEYYSYISSKQILK